MSEIAIPQPASQSLVAKVEYARMLAASGLLPAQYRQQPANLLWATEYAETLGLAPMAAITGVHVIDGKPSASAALISALVRRAGHRLRVTGDNTHAVAEIVRSDDPEFTFRSEWTMERANGAGLAGKGVWKQYPAAMLKARAVTEVARDACEEALFGLHYTPEELGANVDPDGNVVGGQVVREPADMSKTRQPETPAGDEPIDAEIVDDPVAPAPEVNKVAQAIADSAARARSEKTLKALYDQAKDKGLLRAPVAHPASGEVVELVTGVITPRRAELAAKVQDTPPEPQAEPQAEPQTELEPAETPPGRPDALLAEAQTAFYTAIAQAGLSDREQEHAFYAEHGVGIADAEPGLLTAWAERIVAEGTA